jgi:hypothetical protein
MRFRRATSCSGIRHRCGNRLCRARIRRVALTCWSTLSVRAHPPRLLVHGPGAAHHGRGPRPWSGSSRVPGPAASPRSPAAAARGTPGAGSSRRPRPSPPPAPRPRPAGLSWPPRPPLLESSSQKIMIAVAAPMPPTAPGTPDQRRHVSNHELQLPCLIASLRTARGRAAGATRLRAARSGSFFSGQLPSCRFSSDAISACCFTSQQFSSIPARSQHLAELERDQRAPALPFRHCPRSGLPRPGTAVAAPGTTGR